MEKKTATAAALRAARASMQTEKVARPRAQVARLALIPLLSQMRPVVFVPRANTNPKPATLCARTSAQVTGARLAHPHNGRGAAAPGTSDAAGTEPREARDLDGEDAAAVGSQAWRVLGGGHTLRRRQPRGELDLRPLLFATGGWLPVQLLARALGLTHEAFIMAVGWWSQST